MFFVLSFLFVSIPYSMSESSSIYSYYQHCIFNDLFLTVCVPSVQKLLILIYHSQVYTTLNVDLSNFAILPLTNCLMPRLRCHQESWYQFW